MISYQLNVMYTNKFQNFSKGKFTLETDLKKQPQNKHLQVSSKSCTRRQEYTTIQMNIRRNTFVTIQNNNVTSPNSPSNVAIKNAYATQ